MKKEELLKLEKETLVEIILSLQNMNSRNRSKPPRSDWKPAKMPRPQTGESQGGQPGHKGNFLKFEREADKTIEIKPKICRKCGAVLSKTTGGSVEARHKIDVEIQTIVTKYKQYEVVCPCCGKENREEFPSDVKSHISYGEGVQSIGVLLTQHANVSYGKTAEIMNEVFEVPISAGTLVNHTNEFASKSGAVLNE